MLSNSIKFTYFVICLGILYLSYNLISKLDVWGNKNDISGHGKQTSPYSLQMYHSIEKYSKQYRIPRYVAYNVAYSETGYRGPFHWNYQPVQISYAGAVGPMQIIPKYAHPFAGRKVTEKELLSNIDLNVKISMKMLRSWYNMHGNWTDACGAYNSGRPIHNDYAMYCSSNKNYKKNWIPY